MLLSNLVKSSGYFVSCLSCLRFKAFILNAFKIEMNSLMMWRAYYPNCEIICLSKLILNHLTGNAADFGNFIMSFVIVIIIAGSRAHLINYLD